MRRWLQVDKNHINPYLVGWRNLRESILVRRLQGFVLLDLLIVSSSNGVPPFGRMPNCLPGWTWASWTSKKHFLLFGRNLLGLLLEGKPNRPFCVFLQFRLFGLARLWAFYLEPYHLMPPTLRGGGLPTH
ncbi:UNVERIFIED_CONTAM: hypothetical protein Slati_1426200 [Sesamum latifolium]|uniref:Uncharacterized protein n=1 Tax=Sesamum latifolium TaxID=2727402 RepID=A0AAW2X4E8_9LAMI